MSRDNAYAPSMPDLRALRDPLRFGKLVWPDVVLYREQRETVYHTLGDGEYGGPTRCSSLPVTCWARTSWLGSLPL
jgi:hypothetical protein